MKRLILMLAMCVWLVACGAPPAPAAILPTPTVSFSPTITSPTGYRPLQMGDSVEGATISYQYVVPTLDEPAANIAFGVNLMQLVLINPDWTDNFIGYVRDISKSPVTVLGYDEATPNQTEPKAMTFDGSKPIEIVFIQLVEGTHFWSVTETDGSDVQAAYKIVRRKDGGLRFIDAYGLVALYSANSMLTLNGGGTGLMFSSRLALLKLILTDQRYQRGTNPFATYPVDFSQYAARILKLDPTREGMAQNRDWALASRPLPAAGGIPGP